MDGFLARVELHEVEKNGKKTKPTEKHYEDLHLAMLAAGFSRLVSFNKVRYELPHATYDKGSAAGNETSASVLAVVTKAVASVWSPAGIVVVGYTNDNYKQNGLRPARQSVIDFEKPKVP